MGVELDSFLRRVSDATSAVTRNAVSWRVQSKGFPIRTPSAYAVWTDNDGSEIVNAGLGKLLEFIGDFLETLETFVDVELVLAVELETHGFEQQLIDRFR